MRKLASVQIIKALHPIPNSDKIELADVLGWHVVVRKGEFHAGDTCVYVETDSIMPDKPEFAFLKHRGRMKPITTTRIRGQISQGICFPLSILPQLVKPGHIYLIGQDVTDILAVKKYSPPEVILSEYGNVPWVPRWSMPDAVRIWLIKHLPKGWRSMFFRSSLSPRPKFIPKTDETRVQVLQQLLDKYAGQLCYVTEKLDGTSTSCWVDEHNKAHVATRNNEIARYKGNMYWDAWAPYIKLIEAHFMPGTVFQAELCGPAIQRNSLQLEKPQLFLFNIYDYHRDWYIVIPTLETVAAFLGMSTVPVLTHGYVLGTDIDALVEMARGKSVINPTGAREGIVIRPMDMLRDYSFPGLLPTSGLVSFKVINPDYLLEGYV